MSGCESALAGADAPAAHAAVPFIARGPLYALLLLLCALNALAPRIALALAPGLGPATAGLFGVSVVIWFALYALAKIGLDEPTAAPGAADWFIAAGAVTAALVPLAMAGGAAVFTIGLWLLLGGDRQLRPMAPVALALSANLLWGPAAQLLLGPEVARIESALVASVSGLETQGNIFVAAGSGQTFVIAGPCSSLANISLALVLLVTLCALLKVPLTRALIPTALIAMAAIVAFNTLRMAAIGLMPDHYVFLHEGLGRELFSLAAMITMAAIIGRGILRAAHPRP